MVEGNKESDRENELKNDEIEFQGSEEAKKKFDAMSKASQEVLAQK